MEETGQEKQSNKQPFTLNQQCKNDNKRTESKRLKQENLGDWPDNMKYWKNKWRQECG